MKITRRRLLGAAAAGVVLPSLPLRAQGAEVLRAAESSVQLAPSEFPATDMWTFGGRVPGSEIRVKQGGRVVRELINELPQATTIHWHGIRLDNAMDGVPGLTQDPVAPGGSFTYDFAVPDAGTYWYHSHMNGLEQVSRGMAGPLIVEETEPPEVDRDIVLMLSDWRLVDPAAISEDFDNPHDASHAGRIGNFVTTSGTAEFTEEVGRYERLRLRVINAAPGRIFELSIKGLEGWVAAVDGMPVETLIQAGQIFLAPGGRVDLIVDVTAPVGQEAFLLEIFQGEGFSLASFTVVESDREPRGQLATLPLNPGQALPMMSGARTVPLGMEGGAMRGLTRASVRGEQVDGRTLAEQGLFWALNGNAGVPPEPFIEAERGETLRIPIANMTAFPHAMHLHGHHFREVLATGGLGPARDTILVDPGTVREIAVLCDNPGDWLFHCHMLSHHAAGMATWIKVL
ncbi:multicopper oxidase family protein [Halovulum sp. GXIMD14794]